MRINKRDIKGTDTRISGRDNKKKRTDLSGGRPVKGKERREERDRKRSSDVIFGINPVAEAFRAGRGIEKLFIAEGRGGKEVTEVINLARSRGVKINFVPREAITSLTRNEGHQGIAAVVSAGKYCTIDDILKGAGKSGEPPLVVVLDGIQDPQNLGAIVRSALCAGVHGIVIPKDRAAGLTPAAEKAAAGALSYMPVAKVTNIAQTLEELKKEGFWVTGTEGGARETIYSSDLKGPSAIVIGSEGEGIRPLVAKKCDMLVSIPVKGKVSSLNASAAAAVMLYEAVRQRGGR